MAFNFSADTRKNYLQTANQNAPDAGSALKVLSLNLPNYLGGNPIAPDALLRPGLSTNAMVGGTPDALPTPAPAGPVPSPSLADVAVARNDPGGLGTGPVGASTAPPPGLAPFTSAPIAALATNALAPQAPDQPLSNPTAAPPSPGIEFHAPRPDVFGGNDLAALLSSLFQGSGGGNDRPENQQI